ncbi:TetR/AcrR family transcriptional regulator [Maridesulfovibrio zosterae]|uniref:TetR/AcrR family transcriptional regulator n=1 Tax=Maridesulfovibrio zosterae TaxID=82171 RepID=UPI00040A3FC8|nr:CerR family C-terminal domain-containing protein [Maridesulfovibrio zosterae]
MTVTPKGKTNKARGEETREKLVQVGLKLFALNGFNGVSMRNLASVAEVNLATVGYHFGGKMGLYEAVLRDIIKRKDLVFPDIDTVRFQMNRLKKGEISKCDIFSWFYRKIVLGMIGTEDTVYAALIIDRELVAPSEHYELLDKEFFSHSMGTMEELLEFIMDGKVSREEIMIISTCLIGMALKFVNPKVLMDRVGWDGYTAERVEEVTEILCRRAVAFVGCEES